MLEFFLFIIYIACNICSGRTTYDEKKLTNANFYYFDPTTYFAASLLNINKDVYRTMIKSKIKCTGYWCIDHEWKCGTNNDCYHVEHIIPTANKIPDIANCSTDILGNLVMSYGGDNRHFGEKIKIYGSKMVQTAYESIYQACYKHKPSSYPKELCLSADFDYMGLFLTTFTTVLFIIITIYFNSKYRTSDSFIVENY